MHQTPNILSCRRVRAYDAIGFPRFSSWLGVARLESRLSKPRRNPGQTSRLADTSQGCAPQPFGIVATKMTNIKRYNLARLCIHRDSDLWQCLRPDEVLSLISSGIASMNRYRKSGIIT
jgi:hypothetical protein